MQKCKQTENTKKSLKNFQECEKYNKYIKLYVVIFNKPYWTI